MDAEKEQTLEEAIESLRESVGATLSESIVVQDARRVLAAYDREPRVTEGQTYREKRSLARGCRVVLVERMVFYMVTEGAWAGTERQLSEGTFLATFKPEAP